MSQPYRSWVEVSLGQISENFRAVRTAVGSGVEVMAVVKADAYGHGAGEVSRRLEADGARWLAVSNVGEGAALRRAGIGARIVVMADFLPFEREALLEHDLTPVIHSLADVAEFDRFAARVGAPLCYHLKLDTGMGRLGTQAPAREIAAAVQAARHAQLEGLMTHFASSADYTSQQTDRQVEAYRNVLATLRADGVAPVWLHLSSTNSIAFSRREAWGNMVRAGHAIYGYVSPARGEAPKRILNVKPALSWKATILALKDVPEGALIGYGGMFRAPRPMRIAVLAVGYADGFPHRLSNKGKVIAGGRLAPVIGAVSMDLTTIDVSQSPEVKPGDAVTLLGSEGDVSLDAQQIARAAGTISYSVLCGINVRVKRVYV
ncbi:MAG TPA: alanine racemase [Bryobacteraceae bacterium]|nr:alanine racemase [Bryobacteraceae bacterium]